jgi:hypothetical protein
MIIGFVIICSYVQQSSVLLYSSSVPGSTPVREGFRAIVRQPFLAVGEIAWRWGFGAAFWALVIASTFEYLNALPVTPLNWLMWKTGLPPLMSEALSATIAGSGYKLLRITAVLVPGLLFVWTLAAALGRTATLRAMLPLRTVGFRTVLSLSFLRAALVLAGFISLLGVFAMAARAYTDGPGTVPHAGRATATLLLVGALVYYCWSVLNWFLSLAAVLAAFSGDDVISSLSRTLSTFNHRKRKFFAVSAAFGALHLFAFLVFTAIAFFALGLAGGLPGKMMFVVLAAVTLAYFAVADMLYIARLAAYAAIVGPADLA